MLVGHERAEVTFRQRFVPETANLQFLSCGEYTVPPGCASVAFCSPEQREPAVHVEGRGPGERGRAAVRPCQLRHALRAARRRVHPLQPVGGACRAHPVQRPGGHGAPGVPLALRRVLDARRPHPSPRGQGRLPDVRRRRGGRQARRRLHVLQPVHESLAAAQPHRPGRGLHLHQGPRRDGGVRVPEKLTFVHSLNEGDMVTIPYPQLPPGVLAGGPARVHLVHRRRAALGGRQEQGLHGGQR
ncbi:MAG: hypothetical protein M0C28_17985 [Candidatus Moduliflexus flocculans]|nr:hypothetical protein [Candidatus Moduliflexus flocculans]